MSDSPLIERLTLGALCVLILVACGSSPGRPAGEMVISVLDAAVRDYDPSPLQPRLIVDRVSLVSVVGLSEQELRLLSGRLEDFAVIGVSARDSTCVSDQARPADGCMEMVVRYYERRGHDTTAVRVAWHAVAIGGGPIRGGDSYQATLIVVVADGEARVIRREGVDYAVAIGN